ncbi:MAG TPA: hypothetical protein DEA82_07515, partial [Flavobacteriaceae bacterium]|nr:hypothetical protein [Flavobacteriaceae bacterium]
MREYGFTQAERNTYFDQTRVYSSFGRDTLNDHIADGRKTWRLVRNRISDLFLEGNDELRKNKEHCKEVLFRLDEIEMQL